MTQKNFVKWISTSRCCVFLLFLLFVNLSCVSYPYQPRSGGLGYSEQKIPDTYEFLGEQRYVKNGMQIEYCVHSQEARHVLYQNLLYRSAEYAKSMGYDFFRIDMVVNYRDGNGIEGNFIIAMFKTIDEANQFYKTEFKVFDDIETIAFITEFKFHRLVNMDTYYLDYNVILRTSPPIYNKGHFDYGKKLFSADSLLKLLARAKNEELYSKNDIKENSIEDRINYHETIWDVVTYVTRFSGFDKLNKIHLEACANVAKIKGKKYFIIHYNQQTDAGNRKLELSVISIHDEKPTAVNPEEKVYSVAEILK